MRRLLPILTTLALLLGSSGAWAHAVLLGTAPAADSSANRSPGSIGLEFNEPVQLLSLKLLDGDGRDVTPSNAPTVTEGQVSLPLPVALADGRYMVSWRVASLDGHIVAGSFAFAVGVAVAPSPMARLPLADDWRWPGFALHALARILTLLVAGAALFRLLLRPPHPLALRARERRLALIGLLAQLLLVGAHGAMRAGLPIMGLLSFGAWWAAIEAPDIWLDGLSLLGLLALALGRGHGRFAALSQVAAACIALAGFAGGGHVLAVLPPWQGQIVMYLHGLTAALWIGAFDPLRRTFARNAGPPTAALFDRFQHLGFVAVLAVVASGVTMAWLLLPRWSDLWSSDYGLTLSAKLLAVLTMLAIAGLNRFWLTRSALAGTERMKRRLVAVLRLDLVVALVAVLLAVGLSLGPPPARTIMLDLSDASYAITLTLTPGLAGDNSAEIHIAMPDGMPIDPKQVELRVEAPSAGIEPSTHEAKPVASGFYRIGRLPLWAATGWKLRLGLMIDDFTMVDREARVTLPR